MRSATGDTKDHGGSQKGFGVATGHERPLLDQGTNLQHGLSVAFSQGYG
jgi:hypothetical protein